MSLISDALKTAQRERSGQTPPGSGDQPLLDGFFPYVSTSTPSGQSQRARIAMISGASLVILIVAAWFGLPAIKRAMGARSGGVPPTVQLHGQAPITSATPPVQAAPVADSEVAAIKVPDPAPIAARVSKPAARSTVARTEKPSSSEAMTAVAPADSATPRRDTTIAQPSAVLPSAPDRRGASRRNFETEAIAAFNAGDYPTARAKFDTAVRVTPTASTWTNYGVTLEKLGDPQGAARAYRTAMGIDPNYFNAWLYLARVYNLVGDVTQAVPLFNRALEIEPNNSDVNADLAELEFKAGAFTDARRYAEVAARSNPSNARAHYYLALSADTLKDANVARRAFEDYLRTMVGQERENALSIGYARMRLESLKGRP
jgi:tetratricopeptide (TPR) repeat protein